MKRALDIIFSTTTMKGILILLAALNIIVSISYAAEGDTKSLWNSLNWILWIGIVFGYQILTERNEKRNQAHQIHMDAAETQIRIQQDLITAQKDYIRELEEKAEIKTGQYKSKKDSRF